MGGMQQQLSCSADGAHLSMADALGYVQAPPTDLSTRQLAAATLSRAAKDAMVEALDPENRWLTGAFPVRYWLDDEHGDEWHTSKGLTFQWCLQCLGADEQFILSRIAACVLKNAIIQLCRRAVWQRHQIITDIRPDEFISIPIEQWFGADENSTTEALSFPWCCRLLRIDPHAVRLDVARVIRNYTRDWDNVDLDWLIMEYAQRVVMQNR